MYNGSLTGDVSMTIASVASTDCHKVPTFVEVHDAEQEKITVDNYEIRRLMPVECARLQGMPDWWTSELENPDPTEEDMEFWRGVFNTYAEATKATPKTDKQIRAWLKKPHSDSAEYKMWGNGMALPCVLYVMEGVAEALQNPETDFKIEVEEEQTFFDWLDSLESED